LTYQSDRPDKEYKQLGLFTCGQVNGNLAAARSLVKFGDSAVPAIEKELDSIEVNGDKWGAAHWLLLAYSKIKGVTAYPRLQRMNSDNKLDFLRGDVDDAIALSLGLTSYVSSEFLPGRAFHCARGDEPRDALDLLILAWERNDREWLQTCLGPHGKTALTSLSTGRPWAETRSDLWRGASNRRVAVGYHFAVEWPDPEETLGDGRSNSYASSGRSDAAMKESVRPEIETAFESGVGNICGTFQVRFLKIQTGAPPSYLTYLVDNSDLVDLFRLISSCASE
jgi:hypothetical protein